MAVLTTLTDGKISGTGFLTLRGKGRFGGALISTDGTNAAVVEIRRDTATGKKIFDVSTVSAGVMTMPVDAEGTLKLYYSITGTGASAQLYEWVN